jgi:hypothetical protein
MQGPNLDYASPNAPRKAKTPWIIIVPVVAIALAVVVFAVYWMLGA